MSPLKTSNFSEIPLGFYIYEANFETSEKTLRTLRTVKAKTFEGPYIEQPTAPTHFNRASIHDLFWDWADKNLPLFSDPKTIPHY